MNWMRDMNKRMEEMLKELTGGENQSASLFNEKELGLLERKQRLMDRRNAEIVKGKTAGEIHGKTTCDDREIITYGCRFEYLIKQGDDFYVEEEMQNRRAVIQEGEIIEDHLYESPADTNKEAVPAMDWSEEEAAEGSKEELPTREPFIYDRLAAVKYAERWWNSYNPAFKKFDVDCTNYVSQCLYAGGAPMTGYPNRSKGWWYRNNNWSFSWAVAHSLRWYLSGATKGLRAQEVSTADQLQPGDVICYDFEGDGKWDHNTIVVAKDSEGMPLVNAHTNNSRMRYWAYEDSAAWTPNIKYKLFHIVDDR